MGDQVGGVVLFSNRADGSPVLVGGGGQIRTFGTDGSLSLEGRVTFSPVSGVVLPDGGLLLVGQRNETAKGVWVTRLDARLQPVLASGAVGESRLDLASLYSGSMSGDAYTGVVRLSPDARYAYFPASYVERIDSRKPMRGRRAAAAGRRADIRRVLRSRRVGVPVRRSG